MHTRNRPLTNPPLHIWFLLVAIVLAASLAGAAYGAPTITIGAPSGANTNSATPITYTVTYVGASDVSLAAANVTLNTTGTAAGSVEVSGTGTDTRTVTVSNCTGDGTIGISIAAGTAVDAANAPAPAAGPSATFNVDNTAPTMTVIPPSTTSTSGEPLVYTLNFTGESSIAYTGKVTLVKTGTASGSISYSGTGLATRTVTVSGIGGVGTLQLSIAAGLGKDAAGNYTPQWLSPVVTVDGGPIITVSTASPTTTDVGPVNYTVTYLYATEVTLSASDITLVKTGTANGEVSVSGTGNTTRTVTISNITGGGTIGISIAAGTARDDVPRYAGAVGPSARFTVDNGPTLSISDPSASATQTGPISYTVTYVGATSVSLLPADVALNLTGTANGTVSVDGSDAKTRTVTISNITGEGTIGISIAPNTALDELGRPAPAAGPSDTFVVDVTPPLAFTPAVDPVSWTNGSITVTFATTDPGSGIAKYTMAIDAGTYAARNSPYLQAITSIASGTHTVHVKAYDNAGNTTIGDATIYVDKTAPVTPKTPTDGGTWTTKPIVFNWTATTDAQSGIDHYVCQIGTTPGDNDVFGGVVGMDLTRTITGISGKSYYCRVRAVDSVGNVSAWSANSNGITVDTDLPVPGTASCAATSTTSPIVVSYTGASDAVSGLKTVRLWYKNGASGVWTTTALTATGASGSFDFVPTSEGTFYFGLVAQDNALNITSKPTGDGDCSTVFTSTAAIKDLTSTSTNGAYTAGEAINVQIKFGEPVNVDTTGGVPSLKLATGVIHSATYTGGSGTDTLTFDYTVQAGDSAPDLDYTGKAALLLNGATIKTLAGADAYITLPIPGAAGSLGANKDIMIVADALASAAGAKSAAVETIVKLLGPVVTRTFDNYFYVENVDRACGIRVNRVAGVSPVEGTVPAIIGTVRVVNGERVIDAATVAARKTDAPMGVGGIPKSLGMNGRVATSSLAQGQFVTLWGKAKVDVGATNTFTLDDGSASGLRVQLQGVSLPNNGAMLVVTGVLGADDQGVVLRVNKAADMR